MIEAEEAGIINSMQDDIVEPIFRTNGLNASGFYRFLWISFFNRSAI